MAREWMTEAREQKGLSCKEAGKLLGMSESYYFRIENGVGKKRFDLPFAVAVSKVLGIPLTEICDREGIV